MARLAMALAQIANTQSRSKPSPDSSWASRRLCVGASSDECANRSVEPTGLRVEAKNSSINDFMRSSCFGLAHFPGRSESFTKHPDPRMGYGRSYVNVQ